MVEAFAGVSKRGVALSTLSKEADGVKWEFNANSDTSKALEKAIRADSKITIAIEKNTLSLIAPGQGTDESDSFTFSDLFEACPQLAKPVREVVSRDYRVIINGSDGEFAITIISAEAYTKYLENEKAKLRGFSMYG